VLRGNHKSWDEYLSHIEFAYNCVVHSTTKLSSFEVVYGFNPLTPLDLIHLPTSFEFVHKEGVSKYKFIKELHEKVQNQIQTQVYKVALYKNKGKRVWTFQEGGLVWLHLRKERFPHLQKSKLSLRGDGPFKIIKKINDNAYQLDLPAEYGVHSSFNITDLILFVGTMDDDTHSDLRTNPLKGGGEMMRTP